MKTLLIILLIILVLQWFIKQVMPYIIIQSLKRFADSHQFGQNPPVTKKKGKVEILNQRPTVEKKNTEKVGEYVEFEEIK